MIDNIISVCFALLSYLACCCFLKKEKLKERKNIKAILPENKKEILIALLILISVVTVTLFAILLYKTDCLSAIKRIVFLVTLWPIAFIDHKKHIIPNKILIFLLAFRAVTIVIELITNFSAAKNELVNCLITAVIITVCLCLFCLIIKNGMGFGDIKLFAVLGLYFGIRSSLTCIVLSFFVSFCLAIYLLVFKGKNKKDGIAFAPSILIGTFLAFVFFGA